MVRYLAGMKDNNVYETYIGQCLIEVSVKFSNWIDDLMINSMVDIGTTNEVFLYTLEVRESNEPALALYKSLGFVPTGRRKGYYKNPEEDAILMDLDLTDPNTLKRFGIED